MPATDFLISIDPHTFLDHNFPIMKSLLSLALAVVFTCSFSAAQSAPMAQMPSATDAQSADRTQIDAALKKYIEAYEHKSLPELKAVWPRVEAQGKEYDKIEAEFADASAGTLKITLKPLQTEVMTGQALVQCERTRQYQTEEKTHVDVMGDNDRNAGVTRNQPGDEHVKMKTNTRTEKIWIALHQEGGNWFISTVSEKKPKL